MKRKYFLLATFILPFLTGVNSLSAQPAPPGGDPPCWPPPCIPVDNGLLVAIGAAVVFGGYFLLRTLKLRAAGK